MCTLYIGPITQERIAGRDGIFFYARDEQNRKWHKDRIWVEGEEIWGWRHGHSFLASGDVEVHTSRQVWVSAYHVNRLYGGPEEGGWWYDCGKLLDTIPCVHNVAERVRKMLEVKHVGYKSDIPIHSVLSVGNLRIYVEEFPGKSWPERTPHYE